MQPFSFKPSVSPGTIYRVLEVVLIVFVAVQAARLFWIIATPATPLGDVRAAPQNLAANPDFDPFFRNSAPTSAVVTSLALKLYGTRVDEAIGGGSAIIETPDGLQSSFLVGEEIVPGVKLKAVSYDSVTIDRGGAPEQIFLDQSVAAPVVKPGTSPVVPPTVTPGPAPTAPVTANSAAPQLQGPVKQ